MNDRKVRYEALQEALNQRILVLDGAMGTMIHQRNLTPADFGGPKQDNCPEQLVRTRPDVIEDIHRAYYAAGSDIVETNSFGSTPIVLEDFGLGHDAYLLSKMSAELARKVAAEFDVPGRLRFVAGSMGPTTKSITVTGGITFSELVENFYVQAKGLIDEIGRAHV